MHAQSSFRHVGACSIVVTSVPLENSVTGRFIQNRKYPYTNLCVLV